MPARNLHLGIYISTDTLHRAGSVIHALRRMEPNLKDILHHFAVKFLFGGKVVMQVGLWQPRHIGDQLHRSATKAGLGKDFLGCL
ncbi:MAG: hypothetical protein JWS11_666 [Cypionkella sp.]|nr:hypothetical protein [Cypionkella sp.]